MNWILWIWIGGIVAFAVPIARFLLDETSYGDDYETGDYAMAAMGGLIAAPLWPLLIPGYYVYWMLRHRGGNT